MEIIAFLFAIPIIILTINSMIAIAKHFIERPDEIFWDSTQEFIRLFMSLCWSNGVIASCNPNDYLESIAEGFNYIDTSEFRHPNQGHTAKATLTINSAVTMANQKNVPPNWAVEIVVEAVIRALNDKHPFIAKSQIKKSYNALYDAVLASHGNGMEVEPPV
ncbi:MAG: hypothetical protein OXN17_02775 [Candidatus Poribacteria bacterium]|nr:hypothetical protein [Candidatus Poribacteria bacterium]MDE0506354.1 hypothetical protein [Candidatus Poribacteria bacterium]